MSLKGLYLPANSKENPFLMNILKADHFEIIPRKFHMHPINIGEVMRFLKSLRGLSSIFAEWALGGKWDIVGVNGCPSSF